MRLPLLKTEFWSVVATSAAILFRVHTDFMLLPAALLLSRTSSESNWRLTTTRERHELRIGCELRSRRDDDVYV